MSQFFSMPKKKHNVNFDTLTGVGKRAFAGINIHDKISSSFGMNGTGIRNTLTNNKNAALNKINEAFRPSIICFIRPIWLSTVKSSWRRINY